MTSEELEKLRIEVVACKSDYDHAEVQLWQAQDVFNACDTALLRAEEDYEVALALADEELSNQQRQND